MLYKLLKIISCFAIRIFCRKIIINNPVLLKEKGPLLLASNHPNSFLDSIIIDTLFEQPVWSLARGDVFKKPFYISLLHRLKIFPVYRTSEGVENLSENYKTFDACLDIFRKQGVVMIFSEGKCINEWHLRPLKKGTARLALKAWEENIPLRVLPVGINYSSFEKFGKNVFINFGEIIHRQQVPHDQPDGVSHAVFNKLLDEQLKKLVYEIEKTDTQKKEQMLERKPSLAEKMLLAIPALLGWLVHAPIYLPIKAVISRKTKNTDHYDSVMTALLLVLYPFYALMITILVYLLTKNPFAFFLLLLLPVFAWSFVRLKPQLDK